MRNTSIKILCILCLAALCLSLTACSKHTLRIDMNNAEKVTLYEGEISIKYLENQKGGIELSARDMAEFVELYNNAGYRGLELDYGTTSQWGCVISLRDGKIIHLSAQCNADFWVGCYQNGTLIGGDYYIQSNPLDFFLTNFIDQYF